MMVQSFQIEDASTNLSRNSEDSSWNHEISNRLAEKYVAAVQEG